jgi:hypothetical protein
MYPQFGDDPAISKGVEALWFFSGQAKKQIGPKFGLYSHFT